MTAAVFLDRDGVLIEERGLVTRPDQLQIPDDVAPGLTALADAGFRLVVVTNQAVVARGLLTERDVTKLHDTLAAMLTERGAPPIDAWHFCPHHPEATLSAYRRVCESRKPGAGMLFRAAAALSLDLSSSFLIGDRSTDIEAAAAAGATGVLLRRDGPELKRIVGPPPSGARPAADVSTFSAATRYILERR